MPCKIVRSRPMTLREAKEAFGASCEYPARRKTESIAQYERGRGDWERGHAEVIPGARHFICGPGADEIVMCRESGCEYESDVLCDWPMGRGKTCDLPLCADHARHIGEDRDLCPMHFTMWVEATRTDRLNPWPPGRKR